MIAKKDPMSFFTCLKQIKNKKIGVVFMRAEIERGTERVPPSRDTEFFKIVKMDFNTFDDVIECIERQQGGECEHFYSNITQTQWGYVHIREGKIKDHIPLLEWPVTSVIPVSGYAEGYVVEYTLPRKRVTTEKFISVKDLNRNDLLGFFALSPPGSKKAQSLCNNLIRTIILNKAQECVPEKCIEIGTRQGWRIIRGRAIFETVNLYPEVLHPVLPRSIRNRESAMGTRDKKNDQTLYETVKCFFSGKEDLRLLYLLRVTSLHMNLANECGIEFDLIPTIIVSKTVSIDMAMTLLKNDAFRSTDGITLGGDLRAMKEQLSDRNDAILLIADDSKMDDVLRRRKGLELLETSVVAKSRENHFIPVLISNHAIPEVQPELSCSLFLSDYEYSEESSTFRRLLERLDALLIDDIGKKYGQYGTLYRQNYYEIAHTIPKSIPRHRHQVYICLMTAARTYDAFFTPLFGPDTECFVESWLSDVSEQPDTMNDALFRDFGVALNKEIASGRFRLIQRTKFIVFDKGTDSVIVDDDFVYFETAVINALAVNTMKLKSENSLMNMLLENECLSVNDHHSRCYKIIIQNSAGEPDKVFTYGIRKTLINTSNRRLLNLADKSDFLLTQADCEQYDILPLGVVANNRFVGKVLSFNSNNHIFISGRSGKGKTFFATNLLPSVSMFDGNSIVVDASGSFTRDEVMLALPESVVDALIDFIDVDAGSTEPKKLPVNPLYIGDCSNLPAKKRRIVGFVKAAAGKLSKEDTRLVSALISQRLKRHDEITIFTSDMLRTTLEKGGSAGRNALNLIASVLDDIDAIGCETQGWDSFFAKHKRIPVILIGDAVGENVHPLVDVLLNSLFEWQHDHPEKPLTITIDEIKRMSFTDGSPLHTVLTQGRRYKIRLIGITQDYISNDSHAIDVMKQAGTQIFFEPAKSQDRIAKDLGYKDAADAGLGTMGIGEFIIRSDLYNTKDGCNTQEVIPCSTVKFIDSPLYRRFLREYGFTVPQGDPDESSDLSAASQPDKVEDAIEETLPEVMKSESSTMEAQLSQPPEMVNSVLEAVDDAPERKSVEAVKPEPEEPPILESTEDESAEIIPVTEEPPTPPDSEPDEPEENPQDTIERELQQQFRRLKGEFDPDHPCWENNLAEFFGQIMERHEFASHADREKMLARLKQFMNVSFDYGEQLDLLYDEIWPNIQR